MATGRTVRARRDSSPAAPTVAARLAKQAPARKVTAIVQFKPGFSERKAKTLVAAHGGKVTSRVPFIHGLAVKLPAKQAAKLAAERQVIGLTLNSRVHGTAVEDGALAAKFPKTINADKVWRRGYTGKGVGVAVIDTGIAGDAVDFKDAAGNSRVIANAVTAKGAATAGDGFGHGTHVAGIIAGNSLNRPAGDPLRGKYIGVAPDANLIAVKASDEAGNSTVLDVINGIQFVVDHKAEFNIRVLNLSVSSRHAAVLQDRPAGRGRRVRVAEGHRRRRRLGQPRRRPRRRQVLAGQRPVRDLGRRRRRGRQLRPRQARRLVEHRPHAGRLRQAGRDGPGRAHRVRARAEQRVPDPVPELRDRRRLLQGGRHLDGRSGRRRRRGPAAAGPPDAHARPGQDPAHADRQADQGQDGAGEIDVERALFTPDRLHSTSTAAWCRTC